MDNEQEVGIGPEQSKLAELLNHNTRLLEAALLYSKKRRDVSAKPLHIGLIAIKSLREASLMMVKCLSKHEDREDFAKTMMEKLL